jgi:anti-sigma-K factor RskA
MTLAHDALREFAVAYAFDTLDASDRRAFEAHLQTCAECQRDVQDALRLAEGLGQLPERAPLPSGLRDRVLRAATAEPGDHRRGLPRAPARTRALSMWLVLAASLVAVVAAGTAWTEHRQAAASLAELLRDRQQVTETQQALARAVADATETRRVLDIVTAPDATRVDLAGQSVAPRAAGRVFWSASRGLFFTASSLPALPQDRIYQLWYVTTGAPVSAALLSPDTSGRVTVTRPPAVPGRPKAFALTIEPAGGVPAPTGAMYLLGSF